MDVPTVFFCFQNIKLPCRARFLKKNIDKRRFLRYTIKWYSVVFAKIYAI